MHLIVGDGHYSGDPDEPRRWQALLEAAKEKGCQELSILGDFFDLWIALPGMEQPWHQQLLEPIRKLKESGVRTRYVVGNKDYYIRAWNEHAQLFDEVISRTCTIESEQGPLHLAHGDLVNKADRQYRLWRAFSRSWLVSAIARSLPRRWLQSLSERLARKLEGTNKYHKSYYPEDQLRARARELPEGAGTMVYGHFHEYRELTEGDKRIITLPFLATENSGLWVTESGIEQLEA